MRNLTPEETEFMTEQGRCPFCGGKGFSEGPSGGLSQNMYCDGDRCFAKFNIMAMGDLGVELINPSDIKPSDWAVNENLPKPEPKPPKFSKDQILAKFGVGKRHWWQRD